MRSHGGTCMHSPKNLQDPCTTNHPRYSEGTNQASNRMLSKLVAAMIISPRVARRRTSSRTLPICRPPSAPDEFVGCWTWRFICRAFHSPITLLTTTHHQLTSAISPATATVISGLTALNSIPAHLIEQAVSGITDITTFPGGHHV